MIIKTECKEIDEDWILQRLTKIPYRFWGTLAGVFVRSAKESYSELPEVDYYGGDYYREGDKGIPPNSIVLYVPIAKDKLLYYGPEAKEWRFVDIHRQLSKDLIHEIGHHVSLHLIGYRFRLPARVKQYPKFYKEEERRVSKIAEYLNNGEWEKIDKYVNRHRKKLRKPLVTT